MAGPGTYAVDWAWQRQSVWSQTANVLKAASGRARWLRLGLTVAAAALALAGSQLKRVSVPAAVALGAAAAVLLAAAGLLRGRQSAEQVRRWTRARSVSEAIKSEVFLFLTGCGRYGGVDRDRRLDAEVQRLEQEAGDLARYTQGVQPRTRSLPAVHDVDSYLAVRVRQSQLEGYYRPRAQMVRQRLRAWKVVEVTLALIAAGGGDHGGRGRGGLRGGRTV
jgi:hypothetical protein